MTLPIIHIHMAEGRTMAAKHQLFREVTDAAVNALGVRPEQVRIVLREITEGHYAVAGAPLEGVFAKPEPAQDDAPSEAAE